MLKSYGVVGGGLQGFSVSPSPLGWTGFGQRVCGQGLTTWVIPTLYLGVPCGSSSSDIDPH